MRKISSIIIVVLLALVISGCYTTGLSMRERGSFNYSNFIYGLYDEDGSSKLEVKKITPPIRLAVAQVGENAPAPVLISRLNEERYIFSDLIKLPAGGNEPAHYRNDQNTEDELKQFERRTDKMKQLAKDLGADYIFLFGGSADIGQDINWLEFFDITIVGAFIIPSNKITAEGRASGVLIDVDSGRVVFIVSADTERKAYAPTAMVDGKRERIFVAVRDELAMSLADEFIEKLRSYRY